jgi:hypothetical protein
MGEVLGDYYGIWKGHDNMAIDKKRLLCTDNFSLCAHNISVGKDCPDCSAWFKAVEAGWCPSTHGAAGYAQGTYINRKDIIICGFCGSEIGGADGSRWIASWVQKEDKD